MKKWCSKQPNSTSRKKKNQLSVFQTLALLTLELTEHTDGLDNIPWVGKYVNDVVFHGAHHAEPWLKTWQGRKRWRAGNKNTHAELLVIFLNHCMTKIILGQTLTSSGVLLCQHVVGERSCVGETLQSWVQEAGVAHVLQACTDAVDLVPLKAEALSKEQDPLGRLNPIATAIHWTRTRSAGVVVERTLWSFCSYVTVLFMWWHIPCSWGWSTEEIVLLWPAAAGAGLTKSLWSGTTAKSPRMVGAMAQPLKRPSAMSTFKPVSVAMSILLLKKGRWRWALSGQRPLEIFQTKSLSFKEIYKKSGAG